MKRCQNCSEEMDADLSDMELCEDCADEARMADEELDDRADESI